MNLAINGWDVPSVNFLGAVDDGTGKWAKGFWHDSLHPNAAGHDELLRTFVPTLFEAIEQGKATPVRSTTGGFARVKGPDGSITSRPMRRCIRLRSASPCGRRVRARSRR